MSSDPEINTCGIASTTARIQGGNDTEPGEFPWAAALMRQKNEKPFCGASVIAPQFVLTAAHCLSNEDKKEVTVRLGAHTIKPNEDPEPESRDFEIENWMIHNDYEFPINDVAVIKLKSKIEYSDSIRPICLPLEEYQIEPGKNITVIGWGYFIFRGDRAQVLQKVVLKAISNEQCADEYVNDTKIASSMFCTKTLNKGHCPGDSGGAAMIRNSKKQWAVVGVVSGNWGCGKRDIQYPDYYPRIDEYLDWIRTAMRLMRDDVSEPTESMINRFFQLFFNFLKNNKV